MKRLLFYIMPIVFPFTLAAQEGMIHVSATELYSFLDEMAAQQIISLHSAVKPYSANEIQQWLTEVSKHEESLNNRQKQQLGRLSQSYHADSSCSIVCLSPPQINVSDSNMRLLFRPVYSFANTFHNGLPFMQTRGGAEMQFQRGNLSLYANLQDHYLKREVWVKPGFLTDGQGGNYKFDEGGRQGADYSEMRGGMILSWNWGRAGLIKDHIQWGDHNSDALIFAGNNPSFPMISLHAAPARWLTFDYFHGFLVSEVIDSSTSYFAKPGMYRSVFQPKYIAANMVSVEPVKYLFVSAGNSIVYSDKPVQAAYLIPLMFYKSIDHTLSHGIDNENSQMYINISSRNIKHLHLFASLFVDEFSIRRIRDKERYNFSATKAGFSLHNWPLQNLTIHAEYTEIFPIVYKHRVPSLTFATNQFSLGNFMGDNSRNVSAAVAWTPHHSITFGLAYAYAEHGQDIPYDTSNAIDSHGLIDQLAWSRSQLIPTIRYRPWAGIEIFFAANFSHCKGFATDDATAEENLLHFSPEVIHGRKCFFTFGFTLH